MTQSQHRGIDYLFFGYFLLQIPSTLLFDSQGVYPAWLYPAWVRSLWDNYHGSFRDPFMAESWKHPWFLSACLIEHYIEMPFFFWATYCYFYGAKARPRIIIPSIMYCTNTISIVLAVWAMSLGSDFSQTTSLAPRNFQERLKLCSVYTPFFVIPLINLIDSLRLTWKWKCD